MAQISLSFPDSTYTSANKPSAATLKSDLSMIETAVNTNATSTTNNSDTDVSANSWVLDEDAMGSDSATKLATQQSIKAYVDAAITATKEALYPVGSVYTNESVATNPGTLLGFGTWAAYGGGRVVVGYESSGTFDLVGEELGAETVSVAHTHAGPSHTHTGTTAVATTYASSPLLRKTSDEEYLGHTHTFTTDAGGTDNTGAMSANDTPSTLQPSITAYMWKRTA